MARLVITSAGTMGDFVPFIGLGRRLKARGHDVVMAINPAMIDLARRSGLAAVPCGRSFGAEQARQSAATFDETTRESARETPNWLRRLNLGPTFLELRAAVRDADMLISSSLQGLAPWVHEATCIPWVNATIFPMEFDLAANSNRELSESERGHWRAIFDHRNEVRSQVGLPGLPDDQWRDYYWSDRLVLVATSGHFCRPRVGERPQARITGFWFDERWDDESAPDPALVAFLAEGPPPLVLTLSSLPLEDPARVVTLHAEAATRLGVRLIIQEGWAGLTREALAMSSNVRLEAIHFVGHVSHDWLFPRCVAVIHHGGIGTTAQAILCGRPSLVEPYCNDQFFNAERVSALGVGAAVDHRVLTPENLAEALAVHVLDAESRRRTETLGDLIRAEDGLTVACDLIEKQL
jgi:UDP:flavonoid glycosyltransferase YjiC (YdhE family)